MTRLTLSYPCDSSEVLEMLELNEINLPPNVVHNLFALADRISDVLRELEANINIIFYKGRIISINIRKKFYFHQTKEAYIWGAYLAENYMDGVPLTHEICLLIEETLMDTSPNTIKEDFRNAKPRLQDLAHHR